MPCWTLFERQDTGVWDEVLPLPWMPVAVEQASTFGWERYAGREGAIIE